MSPEWWPDKGPSSTNESRRERSKSRHGTAAWLLLVYLSVWHAVLSSLILFVYVWHIRELPTTLLASDSWLLTIDHWQVDSELILFSPHKIIVHYYLLDPRWSIPTLVILAYNHHYCLLFNPYYSLDPRWSIPGLSYFELAKSCPLS
jgi:hypothetical protein